MNAYVQRAAFLADVRIGDRVKYSGWDRFMLTTGRMDDGSIVQFIGQDDDGKPMFLQGKPTNYVILEVPIEAEQDGAR